MRVPAGIILTNPPWGMRLDSGGELVKLYSSFGTLIRNRFSDWGVGLLVADRRLALATMTRPPLQPTLKLLNGGVKTWLMTSTASEGVVRTLCYGEYCMRERLHTLPLPSCQSSLALLMWLLPSLQAFRQH